MTKLKDVTYAGFSSMSYLPWMDIKPGTSVIDALWNTDTFARNPDEMSVKARHLFAGYTEDPEWQVPIWDEHFKDWELLYAADDLYLMQSLFNINVLDKVSNGFYGAAFINKKTDTVLITFRGTDDISDALTDIDLALFNRYNPQLVCVHWFIRHVKKLLNEDEKYKYVFSGHSLGGALVQFGHLISGTNERSCTFNSLGAGLYFKRSYHNKFLIDDIAVDICRRVNVKYSGETIDVMTKLFYDGTIITNTTEAYDKIYQHLLNMANPTVFNSKTFGIGKLKIAFGFGNIQKGYREHKALTPKEIEDIKMCTAEVVGMLKAIALFRNGLENYKEIEDVNITNFVFPDDWTVNLQTKIGKIYDVTRTDKMNKTSPLIEVKDDSAIRVVFETFKKFGFEKHSTGNFIMYMTDEGDIKGGYIRKRILTNIHRCIFKIAMRNSRFYKRLIETVDRNDYKLPKDRKDILYPVNVMRDKSVKEFMDNMSHKREFIRALELTNEINEITDENIGTVVLIGGYSNCNFGGVKGYTNQVLIKLT